MSKMVCEICGTAYDDGAGACPVCGWQPGQTLDAAGDIDDILSDDFQLEDLDDLTEEPPQKGKAVFDYDAVNPHRRPQAQPQNPPRPARNPRPAPAPAPEEDEEEEESGSNKFLVIVLVVLILALLAVSGYIAYTKLWKPNQVGSDDNKPQQTVTGETVASNPVDITVPSVSIPMNTEEPTEATEAGIPCTGISLVAGMDKLTKPGQVWRLMVRTEPEDTTDKVTFTSGDESVVTVDEYGRVTAVGEGETAITITCGEKKTETSAVVKYDNGSGQETGAAPAEGTSGTGTGSGTVATPSSGVLKLKKTDITFFSPGVYFTLELENGISADSVKWSTSDSSIANVYNGTVTAMGKGICVVRAEYEGQVAECVVRCNFK